MATFSEEKTSPRQRFWAEQIIGKLREAEVLIAQGRSVAEAVRRIGVSEQVCAMNCLRAARGMRWTDHLQHVGATGRMCISGIHHKQEQPILAKAISRPAAQVIGPEPSTHEEDVPPGE